MKSYRMRKFDNPRYGYVIFSASFQNPMDQIDLIEKELSSKGYSGSVVFDLLLTIGNRDTRFQEVYFDGESFVLPTIRHVKEYKDALKKYSLQFYRNNIEKLDPSILTKPTLFKLKRGITI